MSWRRADHRSRSRSPWGKLNSSAIKSVTARTRSEWPRVRRSCLFSEVAKAKICSAATDGSSLMPRSRASANFRSSALVLPALRATAIRVGALSGNTNVIFSRAASGRARRTTRAASA